MQVPWWPALCLMLAGRLVCGTAEACQSTAQVLFQDHFKYLARSWDHYRNYHVAKGEFVITPPAGMDTTALNKSMLPDEIEICVRASFKPPAVTGECAGIVFWASDYDNFYSFQMSNDGQVSFWRRQRGHWLNQLRWFPVKSIEREDGAINEMRISVRGNRARLYLNDHVYTEVTVQPAKGARRIGLLACASEKAAATVAFDDLLVTPPVPGPDDGTTHP